MKKCCLLMLFLFLLSPLCGEMIALFEKPDHRSRFLVIDRSLVVPQKGKQRQLLPYNNLVLIRDFVPMQVKNGPLGFYSSHFKVKNDKTLTYSPETPRKSIAAALLLGGLLAGGVFCIVRKGGPGWIFCLVPVLLRILLVAVTAARRDFLVPLAADEPGYFKTMSDMLNGFWSTPWSFTVGTGFLYLPCMLLTGAKEFYDLVPLFNYFSAVVFGGGTLVLGFLILRRWGVPDQAACLAMLLWAVYPFISFHFEDWNALRFQQFFLLPRWFSDFNGHFYYSFCINAGFNAMSDMPGLFLVLGALYLTLVMPGKYRYAALFGALYGFACLVRINYILLAPAFAYVLWNKFEYRRLAGAAGISVGAFLAVFGIQLLCNTLQFGSPLTFGYVLHYTQNMPLERPDAGWTWHTFSKLTHLRYLLRVNLPVFALGTAALWVMRDRFKQTVLSLFCVPLVLFFCGYSHTFCDARRFVFPAFAGFVLAAASVDFRQELFRRDKFGILAGCGLLILFCLPFKAPWKGMPFLLGDGLFLRLAGIGIPLLLAGCIWRLLRKKAYQGALFVFLSGVFYFSPPEVLAAGMLLLLFGAAARHCLPQVERVFQFSPGGEDISRKEKGA